ncbi:MAG TPA: hypothetical protein VFG69_14290 [Nannocystaceae bacterium]|nr:hypothetical protein [Nannocystaceae bacterium]
MADDDDVLLPTLDERAAIIDALAELVRARGHEHLVLGVLVEPDERHFPDKWGGGEGSLRRLVKRLFVYADLELDVRAVIEDDVGLGPMAQVGPGALAWFVKLDQGSAVIAVRESTLREPATLVPALARAVAEAWRARHRLVVRDMAREQHLVDLTAIYLGFGKLTVPAAVRHGATRAGARLRATVTRQGVMPPRSLAFALAVVASARGLDGPTRARIAAELGGNAAAFFSAGCAALADATKLRAELGVPDPSTWGDPPALSLLAGPIDDGDPSVSREIRRDEDKGVQGMNVGKPVFRVERSKAMRLAKMLGLPVILLGMLAGRMAHSGIDIEMWKVFSIAGVLALLGLAIGRWLPDSRCSEPKCGTTLKPDMKECPLCGGTIAGVIHHPRERLAAEEELARSQGGEVTRSASEP